MIVVNWKCWTLKKKIREISLNKFSKKKPSILYVTLNNAWNHFFYLIENHHFRWKKFPIDFYFTTVLNASNISWTKSRKKTKRALQQQQQQQKFLTSNSRFRWNKKWNSWWQLEYRNTCKVEAHSGAAKRHERPRFVVTEGATVHLKYPLRVFFYYLTWYFFSFWVLKFPFFVRFYFVVYNPYSGFYLIFHCVQTRKRKLSYRLCALLN